MLVLSRKSGERIMIGDQIEVEVIKVCGNRVQLGFTAPADVAIHREEVVRPAVGLLPSLPADATQVTPP